MVSRFPGSRPTAERAVEISKANSARGALYSGQVGKINPDYELNGIVPLPKIELWKRRMKKGVRPQGFCERLVLRVGGEGPDRTKFRRILTKEEEREILRKNVPGIK